MATITEVAELAGVSVATVSRYFSFPEKVAKKSALKVEKAVAKLNYTPNLLARNFSQSRSYTIMVLVPDITNPFLVNLIRGIEETGHSLGYQFILVDMNSKGKDIEAFYRLPESRVVDGIIQLVSKLPPSFSKRQKDSPIVLLCDCEENSICHSVAVLDTEAARINVEHLISLGHKRIACLEGKPIVKATQKRLDGYRQALQSSGLEYELVLEGDYSLDCGMAAAKTIANLPSPPTAVFCMSDTMAIGLLRGLKKEGFRVPEDISITGFDDIAFSQFMDPPLTSTRQPAKELGTTAMELLIRLIENPETNDGEPISFRLPTELIVRESSAEYVEDGS